LGDYDLVGFDCDGVLFDTNKPKLEAFRRVACDYGVASDTAKALVVWQQANFGTPRRTVFQRLCSGDFGGVPASLDVDTLARAYGEHVSVLYTADRVVPGVPGLLTRAATQCELFVASGGDQAELRAAFQSLDLARHFSAIWGSPGTKVEAIARAREAALARGDANPRLLFIGDARADMLAAESSGCDFVFFRPYSFVADSLSDEALSRGHVVVDDLSSLVDG
jgi:phosphoglycolate phosphatase-like HAD superfamily hydrolase